MHTCGVKGCIAFVSSMASMCEIHRDAALAKSVGVTKSTCHDRRRKLRDDDWIWRMPVRVVRQLKAGKSVRFSYRHVACEPARKASKRCLKNAVKPLFSQLDL